MAPSRWHLGWLAALSGLLPIAGSVACSGHASPAGDGGVLPGFDAKPPAGLFPLGVSSDRGSLVTADGRPFLLHGEAAWSLMVQLTASDAMRYLADRRERGVNALVVNLIEHYYADHPPKNASGDAPFTTPGDFSTPNEAYFAHADVVIDLAASQGMVVLLTPAYLGIRGGDEGWFQDMEAMATTMPTKCQSYGDFLGRRYASKPNILWLWGGDYKPPSGSPGETCLKAISAGILAAMPAGRTLRASAHWDMETTSRDEPAFTSSIDMVGVYTYNIDLVTCRNARNATPRMPTYLLETCYEGDTFGRCPSPSDVRRQQWWAFLGCGAGEIYGVEGLWRFDDGWPQKLGSPVSVSEQRLFAIAQQMPWQTLTFDDALIPGGLGIEAAQIAAARSADRKHAIIYFPPDAAATVTVDLGRLSGAVTATWQDPTTDRSMNAGSGLTGTLPFTKPLSSNAAGDNDWVLMLTAP